MKENKTTKWKLTILKTNKNTNFKKNFKVDSLKGWKRLLPEAKG